MIDSWERFWMRYGGLKWHGRAATYMASLFTPPYKARTRLSRLNVRGYVAPSSSIHHDCLELGGNIFIGDRVVIYRNEGGGHVRLGKGVHVHSDCIFETGGGGNVTIGDQTSIQPRCIFSAYMGSIRIGSHVQIAPHCAFYPYGHEFAGGRLIRNQPLKTKGGIIVGDDVWFGYGVVLLDGVRIGNGAVIGAGSVVTGDIPDQAIAAGVPARVLKMRDRADSAGDRGTV